MEGDFDDDSMEIPTTPLSNVPKKTTGKALFQPTNPLQKKRQMEQEKKVNKMNKITGGQQIIGQQMNKKGTNVSNAISGNYGNAAATGYVTTLKQLQDSNTRVFVRPVPVDINEPSALAPYFEEVGEVQDITCNLDNNSAIVQFKNRVSYYYYYYYYF